MIKVILFDLGGVLINYNEQMYYDYLSKKNKINKRVFMRKIETLSTELDSDRISVSELETRLAGALGISKSDVQYENAFKKIGGTNKEMLKIAKNLSKRYKITVLSNVSREYYKILKKRFIDVGLFDRMFLSYKIRATKPGKKIFLHVISKLAVKPDEILFIDDRIENIKGARKLGIRGIVFRNVRQLKLDLDRAL